MNEFQDVAETFVDVLIDLTRYLHPDTVQEKTSALWTQME